MWVRRTCGNGRSIALYKELPSIASRARPQSKHDLANVLDVGLPLCLVCAIPFRHDLAIHRQLDNGVVVGEGLFVILCFAFKLLLQRLQRIRHKTPRNPHELVVLRLALCLFSFNKLLALEHLLVRKLNERLPYIAYPRFKYPLVFGALGIVLGYVFQTPITLFLALIIQRLIDEDVGATKFP